jgi:hypothetical protein
MLAALRARLRFLRARMGTLWWYGMLAFGVNRMGDAVNLFTGLYLVPRLLPGEQLGAVLPLTSVGTFYAMPLGVVLLPVGKFLNVFIARGESGKARALLTDVFRLTAVFAVAMSGCMLATRDALLLRLHVEDRRLIWVILAFALTTCIEPVISAAVSALKLFRPMLLAGLVAPYARLAGMLLLLAPLGVLGYLLAQLGGTAAVLALLAAAVVLALRRMSPRVSYRPHLREMRDYALPLVALLVAGSIQGPVESFVIRHRLSPQDSAGYYFVFLFGNLPTMVGASLLPFLWPLVSDRFERGETTRSLLRQSVGVNLAAGTLLTVLMAAALPFLFRLPGPWRPYAAYTPYVWAIGLLTTLRSSLGLFAAHEKACRRFVFMRYVIPLALAESALLYLLPAWEAARPWVTPSLWAAVARFARPSLRLFIGIMLATSCLQMLGAAIEMSCRRGQRETGRRR